ncbi:MAG: hypothetical protein KDC44_12210 [Phaeodactylibacter sp.]|nr:hypothetical protein [Phaeodactylibacter sp.]
MCFSAGASFGASALLFGTGIATVKKSEAARYLVFASAPFLFSMQQFSEGMLWLSFQDPALLAWHKPSIYTYSVFSQAVWPLWAPLSLWLIEPEPVRKKRLYYFLWIGIVLAAYMIFCLIAYGVTATVEAHHIRYQLHFPNMNVRRVLYFLATIPPFFLSSRSGMKVFGITLGLSLVLSAIFFRYYLISVWCFFAAIVSVLVLWIILKNREGPDPQ